MPYQLRIKWLRKFCRKITICKIIVHKRRFFCMKKCYLLLFFIVFFLTFSCKKTETPAYLILSPDDINVNIANFNKEHDTDYDKDELEVIKQQVFTEVLVSLNGKELGYWQLPCKIPLLPDYSKENNIRVTPCVRVPNVTLNSVPYNFLLSIERFLTIDKEGEYRFSNLQFEYAKNVTFPMLETFVQTTIFKPRDTVNNVVPMEIYYEGQKSMGRISLEDTVVFFNVVTPYIDLYKGERHYWEMYYKCENGEMTTYLDVRSSNTILPQQDMIVLPATNSWKKIYIDLSEMVTWVSGDAAKVTVRLGIRGLKKSDANAYFYFDNVKLMSMPAPY